MHTEICNSLFQQVGGKKQVANWGARGQTGWGERRQKSMCSEGTETVLFWDIETTEKLSSYPGERDDQCRLSQCSVACAVVVNVKNTYVDMKTSTSITCWRDDERVAQNTQKGEESLWLSPFEPLFQAMDRASLIYCYNGLGFDFLVMKKYYGANTTRYQHHVAKTVDVFCRVRDLVDEWPKLDLLLSKNGLSTKTADGLQAICMWKSGMRKELEAYCRSDVELLARLSFKADGIVVPRKCALPVVLPTFSYHPVCVLASTRAAVQLLQKHNIGGVKRTLCNMEEDDVGAVGAGHAVTAITSTAVAAVQ